jgi:polyhydroxyalkanoate synthase
MAIQYLRSLCQRNEFAGDGFELLGHKLKLSEVTVPLCSVACEGDHIAAWKDCYRGVQQMGAKDKTFILAQSGHIAGIVNPPTKLKYGHYMNPELDLEYSDWMADADFHEGSWWPTWEAWLRQRSGAKVDSRIPGDSIHPVLCDAPGTYVKTKAEI